MARRLENKTCRHMLTLKKTGKYRRKNKGCVKRNKTIKDLVQKHKEGELTDAEYFDQIVASHKEDLDLPAKMQDS